MTQRPANRLREAQLPELVLPPPFRPVRLRESGDAMAHAVAIADEEGAGALVLVGRFDMAEFAVVLEPDEPLRTARRAFYAGAVALADALLAHAPPERAITFDWPDAVRIEGGLVGGVRLAWPARADEARTPSWLVFGAMIRTATVDEHESWPPAAALDTEGFEDFGAGRLIESFARHLMSRLDRWQEAGFQEIAAAYLERLAPERGVRRDIDSNGDLLVRRSAGKSAAAPARRSLVAALAAPSWLDPATGAPRK